jgi:catechol 2,3-dioxygenase-like lactoylglutathione lyase family enzyme
MKLRASYLKVTDINKGIAFWSGLLGAQPVEVHRGYYEFRLENAYFGLAHNDYGDKYLPSNAGPAFAVTEQEAVAYVQRAVELGAKIDYNGLADPTIKTVICLDPFGNEFSFKALPF